MDWQHLIMNGENLAEYAALLAAEGLLGHQHANSGWGTFDDDNMVGATAFMETLELAVELRRAGYGDDGERLGFDLYPYTEDAVGAVKRSVLQWRFIDGVAAKIDERRAARGAAGRRTPCARTSSCTPRSARESTLVGLDVGTSGVKGVAISRDGEVLAVAEERYPLSTPQPGLGRAGPRGLVARRAGGARAAARRADRPLRADARPRRARRRAATCCARRSSGTTSAPAAECAEIEERVGLERLIELTGNRALTGLHRAEAALAARARARDATRGSATCCCRRTTCACG